MRTVVELLAATPHPAAGLTVAGTGADTSLPWPVLHERARRMATTLAGHGVGPGCRVGLLGDVSVGLITAIQAVWLRGAAFTVLPPAGRAGRQARLAHLLAVIADAGLDLLILDGDADTAAALASAVKVATLSEVEHEALRAVPATPILPGLDDLAILQYTSGSTSSPRGVPVSHGNLAANLDAIEDAIGPAALDPATTCWLSWLPLYHDMGLIGFLALPMSRGCPLVLQSPVSFALRPAGWLERIARHGATSTGAPNFAYGLMTQLLEADAVGADLSTIRRMFSGGEPIDAAMMARFTAAAGRHGLDPGAVVASYGLAESTLAVSFSPVGGGITVDEVDRDALERTGLARPATSGRPARRLVRLGPAVAGTRLRIVDPATGRPAGDRAVGHIEVAGASVVAGYWGDAGPPPQWLRTGDLGYLADGRLVICGRAKDVLFAAGRNVYPQDVEAAAQVPGVRAAGAVAFGLTTDQGDRLVVAVECRSSDAAEVHRSVAAAVTAETGMAPADVVTLRYGRLPKTSSGKLRRAEARRRYLAGEFTDGIPPLTERNVR